MPELVPDFEAGKKLGEETSKPAAPKRGRGRPPGTAAKSPLKARLEETIGLIGVGIALGNEQDGMVIIEEAEALASALDSLARQNPKARKYIELALSGSAYSQLFIVCGRISVRIAANHGASIPPLKVLGSRR